MGVIWINQAIRNGKKTNDWFWHSSTVNLRQRHSRKSRDSLLVSSREYYASLILIEWSVPCVREIIQECN